MEITEEPSRTDERDEDRAGGRKRGKRRAEKTPREVTDEKDAARGGDGRGRRVKHTLLLSDVFCADGKCSY